MAQIRRAWMVWTALAVFLLLSGGVQAEDQLTIGFVPRSLDNPIFLDAFENAHQKAMELGVRLEWLAPWGFSTEGQLAVMESLIGQGVDGIVVSVNDVPEIQGAIQRALDNGIPVITFDADSPTSGRLFHIGIDNFKAGWEAGKALVRIAQARGLEGPLSAVIMSGEPDALNLIERMDGFFGAIEGELGLEVDEILYNRDNVDLATIMVEDYLKANPEVDVFFFTGGWPFYVPSDAMPAFKQWAHAGGIAVGIDIFYDALLLLRDGLLQYLVGQDMASMGALGVELLVDYLRGGQLPETVFVEVGLTYASHENLDELLQIYEPWLVK
ncbi:MAG: hypothetical protein AA931_09695 [Peptococcaceae bacterium 1109]|nr:MAG: hypothetical protein AA931_09695 [Peptococcaceae bacterium 1109]